MSAARASGAKACESMHLSDLEHKAAVLYVASVGADGAVGRVHSRCV